jgi:MFS family permease
LALVLGLSTVTNTVTLWEVYALAAGLGFVNLFDNPARQTFVSEMVGLELLPNAVSLNSVLMNSARVIGPAIGGVLIITLGVSTCFFLNAASYAAVVVALSMMRASELYRGPAVKRAKGQVREGLRYVWATPDLRVPLLSMAIVGVFAFNFTVTLPLLAKFTFHGGAGLYSWFLVAMGGGAVLGGLATAFRSRPSTKMLALIGIVFGAAILAVSLSPTPGVAIVLLVPMGAASISFVATNNATLQLRADPAMRGRVMALNAIAFLGSTPIGAPLLGYISDATSPRVSLAIGGVATLLASVPLFALHARRLRVAAAMEAARRPMAVSPGDPELAEVVPLPIGDAAPEREPEPERDRERRSG